MNVVASDRRHHTIKTPHISNATHATGRIPSFGSIARWTLAIAACLWLSLCTALGPLYWQDQSISDFSWLNALFALCSFAVYFLVVIIAVRCARHERILPCSWHMPRTWAVRSRHISESRKIQVCRSFAIRARKSCGALLIRFTGTWWSIALVLFVGWLWIPTTLLSAFGADIRSQIREFSWALNQWTGLDQPYIGFFSFVPMDIYPTAHYMWPTHPTYLTDQHNVVLTVVYGAVATISRYFTGSNDWGLVVLSVGQFLFAIFCCSTAMNRFFNLPWISRATSKNAQPRTGAHIHSNPQSSASLSNAASQSFSSDTQPSSARSRLCILLFFLCCPLVLFSTISLTKSPVFAFSFVWWFAIGYELHMTRQTVQPDGKPMKPRKLSVAALLISTCIMLISAKYAIYIIVLQLVLVLITDRRRWKTYAVAFLLPMIIIPGSIDLLESQGAIIRGDPIESRGVQIQQIARIAKMDPDSIPQSARDKLSPVFNLDQMADSYFRQDADPVKSSGIQSKKVSYRWRTVTAQDMKNFDSAWLEIIQANPRIVFDAFMAKCFGYFDVIDKPYVSMDYYLTSDYVTQWSAWIKYWQPSWRHTVAGIARGWGNIPILGWLTHGNLYVTLTLLLGAAEVIEKRWNTLAWHMPLLLLMGVMITAPANNFERHMLPVAFVFGFVCLTFWRESQKSTPELQTENDAGN